MLQPALSAEPLQMLYTGMLSIRCRFRVGVMARDWGCQAVLGDGS